jgi:FkbM family methyltransferase
LHIEDNYTDQTQRGLLFILERIARSHPLIYLLIRYLANIFIIFEDDFNGVKLLKFNKKINLIDVGASDGIAIKFISKIIDINNVFAFEPNKIYFQKLKKINLKKKIYNYGISDKNRVLNIYIPTYKFLNKKFFLITYAYYNREHLKKVLNKNFFLSRDIKIEKKKIYLRKPPDIKERIDLVKIDVNGHEYEIVKSLDKIIKKSRPVIITEELSKINLINRFLKKYNYQCCYYDYKNKKIKIYKPGKSNPLNFYFIYKKNI